jgi:probable HAF family extracellular repeat protein
VIGVANITPNGKNHAFLWDRGRMRDLGVLPGGAFSYAHAINDHGQVVGWGSGAEGDTHAILWQNGQARDLGDLGTDPSSAWGINNRGQVVGASAVQANRPLHAVLWDNGKIRDLNNLIPLSSGWQLQFAYRINDRGQIVGVGIYHNELHAYLLTPSVLAPKQTTPADGTSTAVMHPRGAGQADTTGLPPLNGPAFPFSLPDTEGHAHTLAEFKGTRVALFFFCGCERCQHCAQTWGQFQHGGAVTATETANGATSAESQAPITLVVYMGDADAARDFARTAGLDLAHTLLLPDPKMDVTSAYHALPCPRVFVLDDSQIVRYANTHADDDPLKAAASTIDTRALEALNRARTSK